MKILREKLLPTHGYPVYPKWLINDPDLFRCETALDQQVRQLVFIPVYMGEWTTHV
jgi:hypothetical protein